jgi:predicted RNA-binding Zn-ribbon protein involved in translation (DUF1610 family)
MADTMRTFELVCPICGEEFDADIQVEALLPDADPYSVDCPECGEESEIEYDAATDILTLEDAGIDDEDEDEEDGDAEEDAK